MGMTKIEKDQDTYSVHCQCGYLAYGAPRRKDAKAHADAHEYEHAEGVLMADQHTQRENEE
jgi:hypothetical protein